MRVIGPGVCVYVFDVHQEGKGERQKVMIPIGGSCLRDVMLYRFFFFRRVHHKMVFHLLH